MPAINTSEALELAFELPCVLLGWGEPTPANMRRVAYNRLTAQGILEREDYGRLADVRELVALRLAPWLRPHRP